MKKLLLTISAVAAFSSANAQCNDLLISEYVEGWSNNKAIEIYNPTGSPFDMAGYDLVRFRNQETTPSNSVQLIGTIPPYGTYVVVIDKRDTTGTGFEAPVWDELQAKADTFVNPLYNSGSETMYFNGNDAIALLKDNGNAIVDLFGKIGDISNPDGWGAYSIDKYISLDHTLIRKSTVEQGVTVPPSTFDIMFEWDSLNANTFDQLGCHKCDCDPNVGSVNCGITGIKNITIKPSKILIYPNPSNKGIVYIRTNNDVNSIEVHNLLGQSIINEDYHSVKVNRLSLNLNSGMYFITVNFADGTQTTKRIVIE